MTVGQFHKHGRVRFALKSLLSIINVFTSGFLNLFFSFHLLYPSVGLSICGEISFQSCETLILPMSLLHTRPFRDVPSTAVYFCCTSTMAGAGPPLALSGVLGLSIFSSSCIDGRRTSLLGRRRCCVAVVVVVRKTWRMGLC